MSLREWLKRKTIDAGIDASTPRRPSDQREINPSDITPLSACQPRQRATVLGTVVSITEPERGESFAAVIEDSTGKLTLEWPGRNTIAGLEVGATIWARGTVSSGEASDLRILDPQFSIRAD